ncbi:MAG: hypothetical protein VB878_18210 [Pirellulaceae bacterium]
MMKNSTLRLEENVTARRRGFLTTLVAGVYGIAILPLLTAVGLGAPQGARGRGRPGQPGGAGGAGGAGGGGGGGRPTPAQLSAMLIQQFDRDGDRALNQRELMMALVSLQQRMGGGGGQGGAGRGAGGQGGRGGPGGRGGGAGGGQGGAGGRAGGGRGGGGAPGRGR